MPSSGKDALKHIISTCFFTSKIPSAWKDATIYPIPKPKEWHCYLQNTRPITLLDTARKLMTKILYNRLAPLLKNNSVLTGGNFASLPGGSCDPPIMILDSIIHDAKINNKPLFIFLQDISKAFDSIDCNMLKLALQRLNLPAISINLVLELFTNRCNTIITAHGSTDPYKVKVGIDQGEVISPLLWVIYIDPLLTVLRQENTHPYIMRSASTSVAISNLTFMDDSNLIASHIDGLKHMITIAQEFYDLNNTKINFDKAELICNRDPDIPDLPLPSASQPFTFVLPSKQFSIIPLPLRSSFRFLGVWFTFAFSSAFVKQQSKTEYSLFAKKLSNKHLTIDQIHYLHNAVLLPRVEYHLKATMLSEKDCKEIMSPMKKFFKNTTHLTTSIPDAFFQALLSTFLTFSLESLLIMLARLKRILLWTMAH